MAALPLLSSFNIPTASIHYQITLPPPLNSWLPSTAHKPFKPQSTNTTNHKSKLPSRAHCKFTIHHKQPIPNLQNPRPHLGRIPSANSPSLQPLQTPTPQFTTMSNNTHGLSNSKSRVHCSSPTSNSIQANLILPKLNPCRFSLTYAPRHHHLDPMIDPQSCTAAIKSPLTSPVHAEHLCCCEGEKKMREQERKEKNWKEVKERDEREKKKKATTSPTQHHRRCWCRLKPPMALLQIQSQLLYCSWHRTAQTTDASAITPSLPRP